MRVRVRVRDIVINPLDLKLLALGGHFGPSVLINWKTQKMIAIILGYFTEIIMRDRPFHT